MGTGYRARRANVRTQPTGETISKSKIDYPAVLLFQLSQRAGRAESRTHTTAIALFANRVAYLGKFAHTKNNQHN